MAGSEPDLAGLPQASFPILALPVLQFYGISLHHSVHFLILIALEVIFYSADCAFDAACLDSVHAVLCFPVSVALLQRPLHLDVSAALLVESLHAVALLAAALPAVALLPGDERVVLPSLSVPRPTRMSRDRG